MLQGVFGKRLAKHFSLLESSSLVLGPKGDSQVALTRMRMPDDETLVWREWRS